MLIQQQFLKLQRVWVNDVLKNCHRGYQNGQKIWRRYSSSHEVSLQFLPAFCPVYGNVQEHFERTAIIDSLGAHSYSKLLRFSQSIEEQLKSVINSETQTRISFLCPSDIRYVATQWACWLGGNVAVPLYHQHPNTMLEYYIKDSQSSVLVTTREYAERIRPLGQRLGLPVIIPDEPKDETVCPLDRKQWENIEDKDALMMYTSGTTGPPKGVVLSFGNIHFQTSQIRHIWDWTSSDVMLHALPLHHTHGIISGLLTPLYSGATCFMLPKFDAAKVWECLLHLDKSMPPVSVFMAVPTMYVKLIEHYNQHLRNRKETSPDAVKEVFKKNIRFVISGSASLPQPVLESFLDITGMIILERYGMTEVGVPLSNLLHGTRYPGCVGYPAAGVEVCIAELDESHKSGYRPIVIGNAEGSKIMGNTGTTSGELLIRGRNVFKYYWQRPEATENTFTKDGWFKTGDSAEYVDGVYKFLAGPLQTSLKLVVTKLAR